MGIDFEYSTRSIRLEMWLDLFGRSYSVLFGLSLFVRPWGCFSDMWLRKRRKILGTEPFVCDMLDVGVWPVSIGFDVTKHMRK